jgi:hypothetical protein
MWNGFRQLVGLVLPIFARAGDFRSYSPAVRWVLHILILVVILVLLTVLQNTLPGLNLNIRSRFLAPVWLPVLFFLVYALIWLGWGLWRVLFGEEAASEFADIDSAWEEVKQALVAADIDLQAVPLFLVLGRPATAPEHLFQAARLPFTVKQSPRPDAPIEVWANRQDGIFVTCVDASRLGSRASLLTLTAPSGAYAAPQAGGGEDAASGTIGGATIGTGMEGIVANLMDKQLTEEERRRRFKAHEVADRPEELRRLTARLEHLCRLLVRDRSPEPAANGILVLIPHAATQSHQAAEATTRDCQQDLASAWKVFRLHCPLIALVCDLETVPGFPTFLEAHLARCRSEEEKRKERKRRLGRRLGWGVGLDPDARRRAVGEQVQWIGCGMLPVQIYKGMRVETPGLEDEAAAVQRNYQLCRFLSAMHEGQRRLTGIIQNGLVSKADGPDLLGGCYLAATGRDPNTDQAFVAGVFERLLESVSSISWSDEALKEEAGYQTWTRYGYIALPVFAVAMVLLVYFLWRP